MKSTEKTVKNNKAKGSQSKRCEKLEENLSAKNWNTLFLSGFTEDVKKVFMYQENLLWKRLRPCMAGTWSKKVSQVKVFWQ